MLPISDKTLLVRTQFEDDHEWDDLCSAISTTSPEGFQANVQFVDDRSYDGLNAEQLHSLLPDVCASCLLLAADEMTMSNPEHPVVVIDLVGNGQTFRVLPSAAWVVENNLSIQNMGFEEFAAMSGPDGIFRGI